MLKGDVSILAKEVKLSSRVAGSEAEIGRNLPVSWIRSQAVRIVASDLSKKLIPLFPHPISAALVLMLCYNTRILKG